MQCLQCQHENPSDAKFCNQCGASFAPVCSACSHQNSANAKFCNQCGTPLTATIPVRTSEQGDWAETRFRALLLGVIEQLQGQRRVTYRTLKYIFSLDETRMAEIRHELRLRHLAVDEEGEVLVWTGDSLPIAHALPPIPSQPEIAEPTTISPSIAPVVTPQIPARNSGINGPTALSEPQPVASSPRTAAQSPRSPHR